MATYRIRKEVLRTSRGSNQSNEIRYIAERWHMIFWPFGYWRPVPSSSNQFTYEGALDDARKDGLRVDPSATHEIKDLSFKAKSNNY